MSNKKILLYSLSSLFVLTGVYWFWIRPVSSNLKNTSIAFYTWNNYFSLDSSNVVFLTSHKVNHLRIKVLEIGWNTASGPIGVDNHISVGYNDQSGDYFLDHDLTPVVFLQNKLFYEIDSSQIPQVASLVKRALQIHTLDLAISKEDLFTSRWDKLYFSLQVETNKNDSLQKVYDRFMSHLVSYEFDCDWTEQTRDKYFYFLQHIKDSLHAPIESTLRLHQYKYRDKMGIPPVDAVNLMCYNMGDLKNPKETNSIFKKDILLQYLQDQEAYPIRLNMAFPLFGWMVVFRHNVFFKLASSNGILDNQDYLEKTGTNTYRVTGSFYYDYSEESLQSGDILRVEEISAKDIQEAYGAVLNKSKERPKELIFFDLQKAIRKNNFNELEKILSR